ncbi:MAG: 2-oxo-4-hydroxy-4-carboxy-5-ureidoimidazoline decarboxylase [Elainella sp.]
MPYSLTELNALSQAEFKQVLGAIFEQTPQIAEQAWQLRPFDSVTDLHQKMLQVVAAISQAEQLALIQAHPDLGSKAKMADASVQEQAGAGLDRLSAEEFERLHRLNQTYRDKFGFPFIIAVKNHTKASILAAFEERIANSPEAERARALSEIGQIALFRLRDAVGE